MAVVLVITLEQSVADICRLTPTELRLFTYLMERADLGADKRGAGKRLGVSSGDRRGGNREGARPQSSTEAEGL
jgi:hypothetical protein